ncbi:unnamed protein product [Pedinophyceae sp. YPF-701]|nr:unnamed protein product [Pedinophyceae sp. YPF-701]
MNLAFPLAVAVMYWSLPIGALLYRIRFLNVFGPRNDMLEWAEMMRAFLGVRFKLVGQRRLHKGERMVYLANHRSWADFFLDVWTTEARCSIMSRWMVFFAFPVFMASVIVLRGIVLFKRGKIKDKDAFNAWLDKTLDRQVNSGSLLLYPEGTRNTKPHALPLKRGMLKYSWSRGLPFQIIVTTNKERVLSEKKMAVKFGVTCCTGFSEVIESKRYKDDFDGFMEEVQRVWDKEWAEVYKAAAEPEKLEDLTIPSPDGFDYLPSMKLLQVLVTLLTIAVFSAMVVGSAYALGLVVPAAQDAWKYASYVLASMPILGLASKLLGGSKVGAIKYPGLASKKID